LKSSQPGKSAECRRVRLCVREWSNRTYTDVIADGEKVLYSPLFTNYTFIDCWFSSINYLFVLYSNCDLIRGSSVL